jgi:hypothetical protein
MRPKPAGKHKRDMQDAQQQAGQGQHMGVGENSTAFSMLQRHGFCRLPKGMGISWSGRPHAAA